MVRGGIITEFKEFAFDYPLQGIEKVSDTELKWRSTTGGDPDGVLLRLESNKETEVTFGTGPITFSFKPKDIGYDPMVVDAGGLNQKIRVSTIKDDLPDKLEFTYRPKPKKGLNAYWVRIVQSNGAMAWTSPVFING